MIAAVRRFSDVDASWLAATIDGEGSIGLYKRGGSGRTVIIQMANTDKAFVQHMRDVIGCGSTIRRVVFQASHKGRKPMYKFSLEGSGRVKQVLEQILPFLIIKKVKAKSILKEMKKNPFGRWARRSKS